MGFPTRAKACQEVQALLPARDVYSLTLVVLAPLTLALLLGAQRSRHLLRIHHSQKSQMGEEG
jgi:hypothetical protein